MYFYHPLRIVYRDLEDKMKKRTLPFLLLAGISLFSGTAFAAGWNVNSRGQQVYQNDNGSVVQNS